MSTRSQSSTSGVRRTAGGCRFLVSGVLAWMMVAASSVRAADELDVLAPSADDPPAGRLYKWLRGQAQIQFDRRRKAVAAHQTPAALQNHQSYLRGALQEGLGDFPELNTPLNPEIAGRLERDDYRIEKIIFESRPQHHVTACLYLPKGTGPFPGVLMPCGHSANGKAVEAYQRACILMAKNGLAVLCYDPIGQGERIQLLDAQGKPAIPGSTSEHTMVGVGALLVGTSCANYHVVDGLRALDYLASRPDIDPKRLGCTGNSGGGTLTSYLMALDDRIYAAAPSCFITSLERLFATIGPQDAEQNLIGQVAHSLEHAAFITIRAPKPTLICVGTQDYFDIDGAWTTFREVKSVYGILGHGERVDLFEYNDPHGFSLPRRQAAMRWMRRWLLNQDDAPVETDFPIHTDQELQCTRTGQVLEDFKGVSAFDLNRLKAEQFAQERRLRTGVSKEEIRDRVRSLLHLPGVIPTAKVKPHSVIEREGYAIHKETYETEEGIELPAHRWVPLKPAEQPLILYLHGSSKAAEAGAGGELQRLVMAGRTVLAIDLRGMGELSPQTKGWSEAFGTDVKEALVSLQLNRPLLGQRVFDVLSVVQLLCPKDDSRPIEIMAQGTAGPIAQHAAVFDRRIRSLALRDSVPSWTSVATTPISHNQLTNVVPGALKVYDLPELEQLRDVK